MTKITLSAEDAKALANKGYERGIKDALDTLIEGATSALTKGIIDPQTHAAVTILAQAVRKSCPKMPSTERVDRAFQA